eukprot:3050967-Pyramimonas_sp.AAC.1
MPQADQSHQGRGHICLKRTNHTKGEGTTRPSLPIVRKRYPSSRRTRLAIDPGPLDDRERSLGEHGFL